MTGSISKTLKLIGKMPKLTGKMAAKPEFGPGEACREPQKIEKIIQ
jgi:hypothetical protein